MPLIDTHAHLDEEAFRPDRQAVIDRAFDGGLVAMVTVATTLESSRESVDIAAGHPHIYCSVGIHPNYASQAAAGDWEQVEELATAEKVVAVGETGLDCYWDYAPLDVQIDYFQRHLELSRKHDLPFVVHCRDAEEQTLEQLRLASAHGPLKGVMHSFCGSAETARACLDLGLYISFAGMLTYKKNQELRDIAATIPADRLMVETDSPYLTPVPLRGKQKRNEPVNVAHTCRVLAEARGISAEECEELTTRNARQFFSLPEHDA